MDRERIYREIFEHSEIGVYQSLIEGGIIEANPAMARMFGYETPAEFSAAIGMENGRLYVRAADRDWHIA